jgi:phosphoglycerate kinase
MGRRDVPTIRDLDLGGKRVLVRADFNVPLKDGAVGDDTRIRASLPTIQYVLKAGASAVLCSHLGRPKDKLVPALSLRPVGEHLARLLGRPVAFSASAVGPEAEQAARALRPGEVLLLENTRFYPGEGANDPAFARQLAALADVFVMDAFGSAHRAHASTEGVTHFLPSAAGFLLEKELDFLGKALREPAHPYVAILGGAKIGDKIGVIRNLLKQADRLLIGGGMANTFLAAQGLNMAESLVEAEALDQARELMSQAGQRLLLPTDAVVAEAFEAEASHRVVAATAVPTGWWVMDIGPQTVQLFQKTLEGAGMVFWNGPMGVFEFPAFAAGTRAVAQAVADSGAVSIVGGGDSVAAIRQAGLEDRITHLSTGGGASLEFMEGRELPGVAALMAAPTRAA